MASDFAKIGSGTEVDKKKGGVARNQVDLELQPVSDLPDNAERQEKK